MKKNLRSGKEKEKLIGNPIDDVGIIPNTIEIHKKPVQTRKFALVKPYIDRTLPTSVQDDSIDPKSKDKEFRKGKNLDKSKNRSKNRSKNKGKVESENESKSQVNPTNNTSEGEDEDDFEPEFVEFGNSDIDDVVMTEEDEEPIQTPKFVTKSGIVKSNGNSSELSNDAMALALDESTDDNNNDNKNETRYDKIRSNNSEISDKMKNELLKMHKTQTSGLLWWYQDSKELTKLLKKIAFNLNDDGLKTYFLKIWKYFCNCRIAHMEQFRSKLNCPNAYSLEIAEIQSTLDELQKIQSRRYYKNLLCLDHMAHHCDNPKELVVFNAKAEILNGQTTEVAKIPYENELDKKLIIVLFNLKNVCESNVSEGLTNTRLLSMKNVSNL